MNPEIYTTEDIVLIDSLLNRFRTVIWEEEGLYGFTLSDIDEVLEKFPDVDLFDEGANDYDASKDVLASMFAFVVGWIIDFFRIPGMVGRLNEDTARELMAQYKTMAG